MLKPALIVFSFLLLVACASTSEGMLTQNAGPHGLTIVNVMDGKKSHAFRLAEKHCAKYGKAAQTIRVIKQNSDADLVGISTMKFICGQPR